MVSQFWRPLWSLVVLLAICSGTAAQEASLRKFLQNYAAGSDSGDIKATRYLAAFVHLRDDNTQQVIVYLIGGAWCGTGGCQTLILVPKGSSFTVLTEMTVVQQPIRVLDTKSNGWRDLGVWVQGGGIQPGYEARLSFNGKEYPSNPTVPPAEPLTAKVSGKVVVTRSGTGEPLYPPQEQMRFGLEESVTQPVAIPDAVLAILRTDSVVITSRCGDGQPAFNISASWFEAAQVHLNGPEEIGLLVKAKDGCLFGANIGPFWVFRKTQHGYELLLDVDALGVELLPSRTQGHKDISAGAVAGGKAVSVFYKFDGRKYQESGSKVEEIK